MKKSDISMVNRVVKCDKCKVKQQISVPDTEKHPSLFKKIFNNNIEENIVLIIKCCYCGNKIIYNL